MKVRLAFLLAVVALLNAGAAAAQDKAALEQRINSVGTLIERSSAAKQIDASRDPKALEGRNQARALHRKASDALQAGDVAGAAKLLDEATRQMMTAARAAAPEQVTGDKKRTRLQQPLRERQDAAGRAAAHRQGKGRRQGRGRGREADRNADGRGAAARRRRTQIERARSTIDQAYLLRQGLDRHDAPRRHAGALAELRLQARGIRLRAGPQRHAPHAGQGAAGRAPGQQSGARSVRCRASSTRPAKLRGDAEEQAKKGSYEAAIKTLEDSTRELVRAIRGGRHVHPRVTAPWSDGCCNFLVLLLMVSAVWGNVGRRAGAGAVEAAGEGRRARPDVARRSACCRSRAEALSPLPADTAGNYVQWVEALDKGAIDPRTNIKPETERPPARGLDHHQQVRLDAGGELPAPAAHALARLQQLPRAAVHARRPAPTSSACRRSSTASSAACATARWRSR